MNKMKKEHRATKAVANFIRQQYEDEGRDPIESGRYGNDYDENNKRTIYDESTATKGVNFGHRRLIRVMLIFFTCVWFMHRQVRLPTFSDIIASNDNNQVEAYPNQSLVIIMGNLRGGEKAWGSLYKNVLDVNDADLALIIGEESTNSTQPLYPNNTITKRAKYIWTFPEYNDWMDAVDLINGSEWRQTVLPRFMKKQTDGLFGGFAGMNYGSGAIMMMMRWFLSQRLQADPNILKQYDRFVVTRSDHYYQCPHLFNLYDLSENNVFVPTGEDWGGLCDRHLVVSRENILAALDLMPALLRDPSIVEKARGPRGPPNPEAILRDSFKVHNLTVKRFDRMMYTCATERDNTRGMKAKDAIPGIPDLYLKYKGEYSLTQRTCPNEYSES